MLQKLKTIWDKLVHFFVGDSGTKVVVTAKVKKPRANKGTKKPAPKPEKPTKEVKSGRSTKKTTK